MADTSFWNEAITLGVAMLGAGLGIMNTWQALNANRVKLRVKPAFAIGIPHGQSMFSIEVVNLSNFPITVSEVGFTLDGNNIKRPRAAVVRPILIDGGAWPRRLVAREAVSIYLDHLDLIRPGSKVGLAYAQTACGEVRYGVSEALKQFRKMVA
ncbi:hypothetical protein GCM10010520_51320 [Rhizobium viscosum]|uniref:Uncharacterized protein n=1 Tax=Rhizobium viscosum TaxID=1673 RepID=A0ABR9IZC1_RHIVS|nr:hypothetical protein [Rhizobium viscosum]MBE1508550.1 hypothetical protein [Rhizobium viscosum]